VKRGGGAQRAWHFTNSGPIALKFLHIIVAVTTIDHQKISPLTPIENSFSTPLRPPLGSPGGQICLHGEARGGATDLGFHQFWADRAQTFTSNSRRVYYWSTKYEHPNPPESTFPTSLRPPPLGSPARQICLQGEARGGRSSLGISRISGRSVPKLNT
jgi:hypothetical protein